MPIDLFQQQNSQDSTPNQGPIDLFQQAGIKQGFPGIAQDIGNAIPLLYSGIKSAIKSAPQAVEDVGAMGVGGMAKNLLAGMLTAGTNVINAPYNVNQYLQAKGFKGPGDTLKYGKYIPHVPDVDYASKMGINPSAGATMLQSIPQLATAAIAPESDVSGMANAAFKNILTGAVQTPQNPVTGAAMGGIMSAPHAAVSGVNAMRPSNLLRSTLSPEELKANLKTAAGTSTQLGEILKNPLLKRQLENILPDIPFSGTHEAFSEMRNQVNKRGQDTLALALGENSPENINEQVGDAILKQHKSQRAIKNEIYSDTNELADQEKLKLELPKFAKKASDYSDAIESTNILKTEPDAKKLFNKLQNYKNPTQDTKSAILDESGKPLISSTRYPSLKEANLLKSRLNDLSKKAAYSPDASQRNMANVFKDLATSLGSDIDETIKNNGSDKLRESYKLAQSNYAKNYSPFLDKDIYKYISGKKDTNTILTDIVKPSRTTDKSITIKKVMDVLPPDQQKLIGYGYLSRSIDDKGNVNTNELSSLIKKLGPRQFKALFPDSSTQDALKDFKRLNDMNLKATHEMANPATGQKVLSALPYLMAHAASGGAGALIGGPAGAAAGAMLPSILGRQATKLLTSEKFRNKLVGKMLKKPPKGNQ